MHYQSNETGLHDLYYNWLQDWIVSVMANNKTSLLYCLMPNYYPKSELVVEQNTMI